MRTATELKRVLKGVEDGIAVAPPEDKLAIHFAQAIVKILQWAIGDSPGEAEVRDFIKDLKADVLDDDFVTTTSLIQWLTRRSEYPHHYYRAKIAEVLRWIVGDPSTFKAVVDMWNLLDEVQENLTPRA
jgi:hypothetical protein